jgi:phenylacetate-CoA ligase
VIGRALELARQVRESRLDEDALRRTLAPRLRRALRYAYDRVPFYRDKLRAAGVDPRDVRTPEDLHAIPVTTKAELRAAGPGLTLASGHTVESCYRLLTSGSTGEPFSVYLSPADRRIRDASQIRPLLIAGFGPLDRLVVLGPVKWSPPGPLQRLGLYRRVNLDPGLSTPELAAAMRELRPTILWTYPENLRVLAAHVDGDLSRLGSPRIVITSAGSCRGALDGITDPPEHFDFYGCAEAGRLAWECRAHSGLHLNVLQTHVELVDGDVIVTTLRAQAMPFLRYRLGDVTHAIPGRCPCGSALPRLAAPAGRLLDPLRLPSGRLQSPHPLSFLLRDQPWVLQFRITQDEPSGRLRIDAVPRREPSAAELAELHQAIPRVLEEPLPADLRLVAPGGASLHDPEDYNGDPYSGGSHD